MNPEMKPPVTDMPAEEFRRHGHRLVDWIADYLQHSERYPVVAQVKPGDIRKALPRQAPEQPEDLTVALDDFERVILPGVTHWNHPRFLAYFAITGSGPGILGDLLGGALNVNAMVWKTGPAATELEEVVVGWLRQMLGLPEEFFGIIMDTASVSTLCALHAARERLGLSVREKGMGAGPRICVYCSDQAHSSVEKACITLGIGQEGVRAIAHDAEYRMDPTALEAAIQDDVRNGLRPCAVVATLGTTSSGSVDPVKEIAEIAARHALWLHVDAAYAGPAAILPEKRALFSGWERADSVVLNPHKWLFTPFDFSAFYTRDPQTLRAAFSLVPPVYLTTKEGDQVHNYMEYGIQLGRRFRALKLWFVLRYFGQEGVRQALRYHIELAQQFAALVDADPDWERMAPVHFSLVCFRARPRGVPEDRLDDLNAALLEDINASGQAFLSQTKLRGNLTIRLAIGHLRTSSQDLTAVWELLREGAARIVAR